MDRHEIGDAISRKLADFGVKLDEKQLAEIVGMMDAHVIDRGKALADVYGYFTSKKQGDN